MWAGELERFCKLSASTANMNAVAGCGAGGARGTAREELSAVLGLISEDAADFVLLKYTTAVSFDGALACSAHAFNASLKPVSVWESSTLKRLHGVMRGKAKVISEQGQWRPRDENMVSRIAEIALAEAVSFGVCSKCRGTRQTDKAGLLVECRTCGGTGARRISNRQYARLSGLDERSWRDRWHWRYDAMMNVLIDYELEAVKAVKREREEFGL